MSLQSHETFCSVSVLSQTVVIRDFDSEPDPKKAKPLSNLPLALPSAGKATQSKTLSALPNRGAPKATTSTARPGAKPALAPSLSTVRRPGPAPLQTSKPITSSKALGTLRNSAPSKPASAAQATSPVPSPAAASKKRPRDAPEEEDWRAHLREITGYDPSKFVGRDEGDDRGMEVGWQELQKEERRSLKLGRREDQEAQREELRRAAEKEKLREKAERARAKKRGKGGRDDEDDGWGGPGAKKLSKFFD